MEEKKSKKKCLKLSYVLNIVLILLIIGISYAWLHVTLRGEKKVSIVGNKLELMLDETNEGIQIEDAVPVKDEQGKEVEAYTFTLENKGNKKIDYSIYLDTDSEAMKECSNCQELEEKDIRYELKKDNLYNTETLDSSRLLDKGTIGGTEKISYELKIWLNYDADNDAQGKVFYGKIRVEGVQNTGEYDNGKPNAPVLSDNMIPVVYNGYNWVKADTNSRWYDYERQMWANAVTVTNESRNSYQQAEVGTKVNMDDILQMFVWIPRYSYTIQQPYGKKEEGRKDEPSQLLPGEIDVKFISSSTKDDGKAQYNKGEKVKEWFTPPGFTFGDKNLSGIWIGKFETGNIGDCTPGYSAVDTNCDRENFIPYIKPNFISWRGIRVSTLELVSMGITKVGNIYGFDQTTYDSHASKNTEWALISYLTQSKYGKYGNSLYTGENKEVYMNNYTKFLTGCSSGQGIAYASENCTYRYDDTTSQEDGTGYLGGGASSTGNITGIYDVNGGAWEYVMGNLSEDGAKRSGYTEAQNSGYKGKLSDESLIEGREWNDNKYYDFYSSTNSKTACNGSPCKGHALSEIAGWYGDFSAMLSTTSPWLARGDWPQDDKLSGVFSYYPHYGSTYLQTTFRIVLTPNS